MRTPTAAPSRPPLCPKTGSVPALRAPLFTQASAARDRYLRARRSLAAAIAYTLRTQDPRQRAHVAALRYRKDGAA